MGEKDKTSAPIGPYFWMVAFVIFNLTDIISTLLAVTKHGVEYEINPIYALTGSIVIMFLFKILSVLVMIWIVARLYHRVNNPIYRYIYIYIFVMMTFMLFFVSQNNFDIADRSTGSIGPPIPEDQKIEVMASEISSMNLATHPEYPIFVSVFITNLLQFIAWRSWEKWRDQKIYKSVNPIY